MKDAVLKEPGNIAARWVLSAYKGKPLKLEDGEIDNENYRVLGKIMQMSEEQ